MKDGYRIAPESMRQMQDMVTVVSGGFGGGWVVRSITTLRRKLRSMGAGYSGERNIYDHIGGSPSSKWVRKTEYYIQWPRRRRSPENVVILKRLVCRSVGSLMSRRPIAIWDVRTFGFWPSHRMMSQGKWDLGKSRSRTDA